MITITRRGSGAGRRWPPAERRITAEPWTLPVMTMQLRKEKPMALGEFPPLDIHFRLVGFPGEAPTFEKVNGQTRVEVDCSHELSRSSAITVRANHGPDAVATREERLAHGVYFQVTTKHPYYDATEEIFDSLSVEAARELAFGLITVANEVERNA